MGLRTPVPYGFVMQTTWVHACRGARPGRDASKADPSSHKLTYLCTPRRPGGCKPGLKVPLQTLFAQRLCVLQTTGQSTVACCLGVGGRLLDWLFITLEA